ncbi:HPr family phosphocarrier protein [Aquisphaera insulae]|uniref:HPr family phosphocarrier protein n=1 Tax=Aquisphaera insulae TaxID=2712864 RepID=UPI00210F39D3|nr:HPr family phosphocarrier protein [Aquisphaera insulae]
MNTPSYHPLDGAPKGDIILVVDDDSDNVESMSLLLRLHGYRVEVALDGRRAIEAANRFSPSVVLLDIGMPGMDGYEVATRLRSECPGDMVIVAISGYGREQDLRRSRNAGFDRHFIKPLDGDAMMTLLDLLKSPTHARTPGRGRGDDAREESRHIVAIKNRSGLHLRAAGRLAALARGFRAEVRISRDGRAVNAASVLDLMTLAADCGSNLEVHAEGPEAREALDAIMSLIERGFDE